MTGKTHQIIGITAGLGWYLTKVPANYNPATLAAVVVGAHIGALLPDADQSAGDIYNSLPFGHSVGKVTSKIGLGHRNITHSLLGVVIIGFLFYKLFFIFPSYWGIDTNILFTSFMIGYVAHLVSDALTVEGIPIFYPYHKMLGFPPKPLDALRIETGHWFENLVIFPLINVALIALVVSKWNMIHRILFK